MPQIIDYARVLERMRSRGFVSLYHNAGAFCFASGGDVQTFGFVAAPDPTIRIEARALARRCEDFASVTDRVASTLASDAWLMPKSHWHYEMHFGNRDVLESLLWSIGIEAASLRDRNDGSAIAFSKGEVDPLKEAVRRLLDALAGSDFLLAFPDARTLVTIHHHRQLWVQTAHAGLISVLGDHA